MSDELPEWFPSVEDAEAQARSLSDRNYSTPPEAVEVLLRELDRVRGELLTEKRAHLRTIEDSQRIRSEFERRGRVEQAAVALVEFWRDQVPLEYCHSPEQDRLTDALIEVVKRSEA